MHSSDITVYRPVSGILGFAAYSSAAKVTLHSHAIACEGKVVLFDPIMPDDATLDSILEMGTPTSIFLTNGNHERAYPKLAAKLNLPACCRAAAVRFFSTKPSAIIDNNPRIQGFEPVLLDGAVPGECALFQRELGILVIGDALTHLEGRLTILPEKYCEDQALLLRSLSQLLSLEPKIVLFAHGMPLVDNPHKKIETLLRAS
jgi:glyoxylase-like metal-dependent hydrolase (beta-lactamase superfamily II)